MLGGMGGRNPPGKTENKVRASGVFDFQVRNTTTTENATCKNIKGDNVFPVLFAEPADIIGHELGLQIIDDCSLAEKMNQALLIIKLFRQGN